MLPTVSEGQQGQEQHHSSNSETDSGQPLRESDISPRGVWAVILSLQQVPTQKAWVEEVPLEFRFRELTGWQHLCGGGLETRGLGVTPVSVHRAGV